MSVGILLISHPGIASAIKANANRIWPHSSLQVETLEVPFDSDIQEISQQSQQKLDQLDTGEGVLVLCDIAGASPCNMSHEHAGHEVIRVSGLNLPMLIKAYNYADRSLTELSALVIEGSSRSITRLP